MIGVGLPAQNDLEICLCRKSFMIVIHFSSFNFYILANVLLGVDMLCSCAGAIPKKEGGIQVLAGPAPSNQTVGSSLRSYRLAKNDP
jgi:hypothetical protein